MRKLAKQPPPHLVLAGNKIDQAADLDAYRALWQQVAGDRETVEPAWYVDFSPGRNRGRHPGRKPVRVHAVGTAPVPG